MVLLSHVVRRVGLSRMYYRQHWRASSGFFVKPVLTLLLFVLIALKLSAQSGKPTKETAPFSQESRVWEGNEGGKVMYHVYGLTASKRGVILAFSEARNDRTDEGPHDLLCKRSTDNGQTWSESIAIEKGDGSFWRVNGQAEKRECWANPAAIADHQTGRVFIFYVLNEGQFKEKNTQRMTRVFYKTSDDDGKTWSQRTEITSLFHTKADGSPNLDAQGKPVRNEDGFACDYLGRAFHMPGPGHGIQLKNGRLLLQFWHRKAIGGFTADGTYRPVSSADRNYSVSVIFSDDQGKTWHPGGSTGLGQYVTESRLAQLADGRILLNGRIDAPKPPAGNEPRNLQNHPSKRRWTAVSRDGGLTWQDEHIDQTLPSFTNVDCGFIRLFSQNQQTRDCLLLSHPSELNARAGMTVSMSCDEGRTWPVHKSVFEGGNQYSDLVALPDGTVGLLYGRAHKQPGQTAYGFRVDEVVFVRFNQAWLR